jgi:hypothetical protein
MSMMRAVVLGCVVAACKGSGGGAAGSGSAAAGGGSAAVAPAVADATPPAVATGSGSGSADAPPLPLDAKVVAARCSEPCLFLVDTPLDKLGDVYAAACKHALPDLHFEKCDELDQLRKCVFAAHGYAFKQKKWRTWAKKPWFVAHPEYKPTQLGTIELANVHELDARTKLCGKREGVKPALQAAIEAWWRHYETHDAPMPKVLFSGLPVERATERQVLATIDDELKTQNASVADVLKDMILYVETEPTDQFTEAVQGKLQIITLHYAQTLDTGEGTILEGLEMHFVFDENDKLVELDAHHFLWD